MWHHHRWPKWSEPDEATERIWPSQLETMLTRSWAGVAQPITTHVLVQKRVCETCGKFEWRRVT